ncbi:MAG: ornithine carbamoyltransferase [bacterium]
MKRDLLSVSDLSTEEIWEIFDLSRAMKCGRHLDPPPLKDKSVALIFQKPSNRTRVSFDVGIHQLGGYPIYLSPDEIQLGVREPVKDVARVLSRYVDGIVARVFSHGDVEELARYSDVPVINALSDKEHPCQILADLYTVYEKRGKLKGIRVAYIGDGNNVCNSWLCGAQRTGIRLVVATPPGYEPDGDIVRASRDGGAAIEICHDPLEAARGADVIYTDVWTSMGQEAERDKRMRDFQGWQVNESVLAEARDDCLVMHCLPAHRGEEITDEVIESDRSIVFDEAENRLHVQKAILAYLMGNERARVSGRADRGGSQCRSTSTTFYSSS